MSSNNGRFHMFCRILSKLCLLFVVSAIAWAQGSGTISGTVADPSGALIPSAKITVTEVSTGISRTGFSGAAGYYVLNSLRPTEYLLSASAPGFRDFTQKGITLLADQSITLNVNLQLGAASETVTVDAAPPQVDTSTATLRQVVDSQRMVELP